MSQLRKAAGFETRAELALAAGIAPEALKAIENRGHDQNRGVAPQKAFALALVTGASSRGLADNQLYPAGRKGASYTATDFLKRQAVLKQYKEVGPKLAAKLSREIQADLAKVEDWDPPHSMLLLGRIAIAFDEVRKDFSGSFRKKETLMYRVSTYLKEESKTPNNQEAVWKFWIQVMDKLQATTPEDLD